MRKAIKDFAEAGGIVYAECGGFMYLASSLEGHRMCGIVPAEIRMGTKLHSLGYREIKTSIPTFFGPAGTILRGHEFLEQINTMNAQLALMKQILAIRQIQIFARMELLR